MGKELHFADFQPATLRKAVAMILQEHDKAMAADSGLDKEAGRSKLDTLSNVETVMGSMISDENE